MVYTVNHHRNANQTTKTYHFTLVRLVNIKKIRDNKYWLRYREKRILEHYWWKYNWCSYYGNNMEVPQIIKTKLPSVQFSSVANLCLTACNPMNLCMPGFLFITNSRSLLKLMPIESVMPSSHFILCHPLLLLPQSLSASGSFPISQLFTWGGQSTGVSTLAWVLQMNTQDWSPLGWTAWISLQPKELWRVFSNTTVQKHQFFDAQLSSQSNSQIHTWPLEKP